MPRRRRCFKGRNYSFSTSDEKLLEEFAELKTEEEVKSFLKEHATSRNVGYQGPVNYSKFPARNIRTYSAGYQVRVRANGELKERYVKTLEEAYKVREELLKEQKKGRTVSPMIRQMSLKSYCVRIRTKGINVTKSFKSLEEAKKFRDVSLKATGLEIYRGKRPAAIPKNRISVGGKVTFAFNEELKRIEVSYINGDRTVKAMINPKKTKELRDLCLSTIITMEEK